MHAFLTKSCCKPTAEIKLVLGAFSMCSREAFLIVRATSRSLFSKESPRSARGLSLLCNTPTAEQSGPQSLLTHRTTVSYISQTSILVSPFLPHPSTTSNLPKCYYFNTRVIAFTHEPCEKSLIERIRSCKNFSKSPRRRARVCVLDESFAPSA